MLRLTTPGASNLPSQPALLDGIFKAALRIAEVNNGFLKCAGFSHGFNTMPKEFVCQAGYCLLQQSVMRSEFNGWPGA